MRAVRLAALAAYQQLFGRRAVTALAEGWRKMRHDPQVIHDLCILGHIFEPDIDPATGRLYPPDELIARAARKSFALALLARAEITHDELNMIREGQGYGQTDDDDDAYGRGR
ncbi:hypothetical protein MASR1M32_10550 [Rhodobacter sp.]